MARIKRPLVTWCLIVLNIAIYGLFQSGLVLTAGHGEGLAISFGVIPVVFFDKMVLPSEYLAVPWWITIFSSAFLHGSWMHLGGNMVFLWVFGDNVEDALGHIRYLVFYLVCAALSAVAYAVMTPESTSPLIGASGAISGVIVAYLMLHPHVKVWILMMMGIPLRIPALWAIGGWIIFQIASVVVPPVHDDTAWFAHLGGLGAGALLMLVIRPRGVRLFADRLPPPVDPETRSPENGREAP